MVCPLLITYHFIPNCSPESPESLVKTQTVNLIFRVSDSVSLGLRLLTSIKLPSDAASAALGEKPHFENQLPSQINCFGNPKHTRHVP